jgi:hypothetical protein
MLNDVLCAHAHTLGNLAKMDKVTAKGLVDPKILSNARMIALDYKPISDQAMRLSLSLADELTDIDPERSRKRQGVKRTEFSLAVGAFVADLVLGFRKTDTQWSYRSQRPEAFTDAKVSYRLFKSADRGLSALQFIKKIPGFYDRPGDGWGGKGFATRYLPTPALIEYVTRFDITLENIHEHFQRSLPRHPLELRQSSIRRGREKVRGRKIKFVSTPETERLEAEIYELNEFIDSFSITGGTHRGFRRIFNEGVPEGYKWNKGGRLYSIGEDSFQRLKEKVRAKLRINGESTIELDIRGSHLTILHSKLDLILDQTKDPYQVTGLPRDIVKAWITMTLGYDKFHSRWPIEKKSDFEKKGINIDEEYPLKEVKSIIFNHYPMMAKWPDYSIDCFDLMYFESVAIMNTMLDLKRTYSIPSLSVHDSLIVRKKDQSVTRESLKKHYLQACGAEPVIK